MIIGIDASRANRHEKTGVGWYAWHLIQEIKSLKSKVKSGEDLHFILYSDQPLQGELGILPDHWESRVLAWPPGQLWTQMRLSFEMLVRPPDVLFIPAHVFPFIHPEKTVMTVHDIAAARFPEAYSAFDRWYTLWSARYAIQKLWQVIVPSRFVKTELKNLESGIWNMDKVVVIHHGYDTRYREIENKSKIEEVLKKYKVECQYLLSVGRLEEKKNTANIIKAFDLLNNSKFHIPNSIFQLVLVGTPGYGYEKVKKAIADSQYRDHIITLGWVDQSDLAAIMNASEVLVFPSLYEGFGLPVLEAMACGTPVVAGRGSSLNEVGGEAVVYVDPRNVADMARGMRELLDNQAFREDKIRQGFDRVAQFSWERAARETLAVLMTER